MKTENFKSLQDQLNGVQQERSKEISFKFSFIPQSYFRKFYFLCDQSHQLVNLYAIIMLF